MRSGLKALGFVAHTFGRQALPMVWDFAECVPFADASEGSDGGAIEWVAGVAERLSSGIGKRFRKPASRQLKSLMLATPRFPMVHVIYGLQTLRTAPIPYADLSDYFYVWLKRALPNWKIPPDSNRTTV